jgi:hypothetical protein
MRRLGARSTPRPTSLNPRALVRLVGGLNVERANQGVHGCTLAEASTCRVARSDARSRTRRAPDRAQYGHAHVVVTRGKAIQAYGIDLAEKAGSAGAPWRWPARLRKLDCGPTIVGGQFRLTAAVVAGWPVLSRRRRRRPAEPRRRSRGRETAVDRTFRPGSRMARGQRGANPRWPGLRVQRALLPGAGCCICAGTGVADAGSKSSRARWPTSTPWYPASP